MSLIFPLSLIGLFIIAVITFVRYEFKKLESSIYESFKKLGAKALAFFAIFNLFNDDNSKLPDNEDGTNK